MSGPGRTMEQLSVIRTPDQRLRVFVSSALGELSGEREAVRQGIERLRLWPVMFELGARPYPPRELYRAYLKQSHVFVGIYWQRYGWVAPGEDPAWRVIWAARASWTAWAPECAAAACAGAEEPKPRTASAADRQPQAAKPRS